MKMKMFLIIILSCTLVLLSACGAGPIHLGNLKIGEVRIGMIGAEKPGEMDYSYSTFNGYESQSLDLKAGQNLKIEYEVKVSKGNLRLAVEGPEAEILWETVLEEDGQDRVEVTIEAEGRYLLYIEGEQTGGSFRVNWQTEER